MPDHLHWVGVVASGDSARHSLADLCGRLQRTAGLPPGSRETVPEARVIGTPAELQRHIRYIHLNECRKGLARDPLGTLWSTHRELVGGVVDPWADVARLARAMRWPSRDFSRRLHAYVSGDPTVAVDGTAAPTAVRPATLPSHNLLDVVRASSVATRSARDAIRRRTPTRRLFVQLARHCGWTETAVLARACAVTPDAVRKIARTPDPAALCAGALCLGDPRLLHGELFLSKSES